MCLKKLYFVVNGRLKIDINLKLIHKPLKKKIKVLNFNKLWIFGFPFSAVNIHEDIIIFVCGGQQIAKESVQCISIQVLVKDKKRQYDILLFDRKRHAFQLIILSEKKMVEFVYIVFRQSTQVDITHQETCFFIIGNIDRCASFFE